MDSTTEDLGSDFSASDISLNATNQSIFDDDCSREDVLNERDELIKRLMTLTKRHNLTKVAIEDIAKLLNSVPGSTLQIPTSKHLLFKELLRKSPVEICKYSFCSKCDEFSKYNFTASILRCNFCTADLTQSKTSFIYLPVALQLKQIISKYFDEIMQYRKICEERKGDSLFDVHDGIFLKNIAKCEYVYSLTVNTDGVLIHPSSKCTLWPILLVCNFLPPTMRFKENNIIVAGLYYGVEKPNFLHYFVPLNDEFNLISKDGLIINSRCFRFNITHAVLDLPAKSAVQCVVQYNGYNACYYCEHPGEKTKKGVRYTYLPENHPNRSHRKMITDMQKSLEAETPINGIKGLSPMVGFKNFDLVSSFVIDYMHAIPLGVVKNLIGFWWDTENFKEPFYILPKYKKIINQRIAAIKACRFTNRKIEPLCHYSKFKASQFRDFLLYYYPILDGFLNKKYYNHFRLLSSAIYTLLQPTISTIELHDAKKKLQKFVIEYQSFYGKTCMTMNVHCLLHLADCVENMGPLWSFSMFAFESFNGRLKHFGKNSNNVINQIAEKIAMKFSNFEKTIDEDRTECFSVELSAQFLQCQDVNAIKKIVEIDKCKFYAVLKRGSIMFTSKNYRRAHKTIDYFVLSKNNCFGKVICYFEYFNSNYALIQEFILDKKVDQILEVKPNGNVNVMYTSNIADKLIYMNFGLKHLIVERANSYELN